MLRQQISKEYEERLQQFQRDLDSYRRQLAKFQGRLKGIETSRRKAYNNGYTAGRAHRKTIHRYHDSYPTITPQELATMNHAYDHGR